MPTWSVGVVVTGALWLLVGVGFAWLFGAACRLGGPGDETMSKCRHGIPHRMVCGQCELYPMESSLLPLAPEELEAEAR